jgi:hypothetical protein
MHTAPLAALLTGLLLAASPASADVRLHMANGLVSLSAQNATLNQILAEWARVGQTRIVNGEHAESAPLTLELTNVPEAQALDILLRSTSGYLLAPRASVSTSTSRFDRILILPSSHAAGAVQPSPASTSTVPPPRIARPNVRNWNDESDEVSNARNSSPVVPQAAAPRPPEATPLPVPPSQMPTAPFGVATPGLPVQTPQPSQSTEPAGTPPR